jgi:ribosome-binding factor A
MQKKTTHRPQRIGDQMKRELAQLLQFEVSDPRLNGVTIIDVIMSKDLSNAKVYFSILNEEDVPEAKAAFKGATGFFRKQIAGLMDLRIVPQLSFMYDASILNAQKMSTLIDQAIAQDNQNQNKQGKKKSSEE